MNKNIFFLSIAAVFSAFDVIHASSAVKHEKVRGMKGVEKLRSIREFQLLEVVIRGVEASVPGLAPLSSDKIKQHEALFSSFRKEQTPDDFYGSAFSITRKHPAKS